MNISIDSIRADITRLLSKSKARKFRVINDLTQEYFIVEGPDIEGCRKVADEECTRLGWNIANMRSEEL